MTETYASSRAGIDPVDVLRDLIRFDTSNPPGNEAACIGYVRELLESAGCESSTYAADPARPNLVTRLRGRDSSAPVLLQGHVDVAPTTGQAWTRPPFDARVEDGVVWGRGALDMKGGLAMMIAAVLRAKAEDVSPAHDIVFAVLSDEESGGELGARFLVDEHSELFRGVRYGIGEFGGFSMSIGGRRFYPIQVAEKRACTLRAVVPGAGGHGAFVQRGGTMARLSRLLGDVDRSQPPIRLTAGVRRLLETMAAEVPRAERGAVRGLLEGRLTDGAKRRLGIYAGLFEAMVRNTMTATVVRAGAQFNVVPSTAEVVLDCRVLPGCSTEEFLDEAATIVGGDVELEVTRDDEDGGPPDLARFDLLADVVRELDPTGVPVPFLQIGGTDGRHFARLGIQTYGFVPLRLPEDFHFLRLVHAADERVPVEAIRFGAEALYRALERM
jgi:acetylornithine deacetylase/succinyl-diaminopimelate desuccinylase-like protein